MAAVNALVFTSIKNNIPVDHPRFTELAKRANITSLTTSEKLTKIDDILKNSTIKRACCLAKSGQKANMTPDQKNYKIRVKIPIPKDYTPDAIERKFGYTTKEVLVPVEYCSKVLPLYDTSGTQSLLGECDPFYGTYCENMKYLYNLENNGRFTSTEFNEYAEECSCHADLPKGIPPGISRSCLLDFCSLDNKPTVYLDSTSRDKPCEGTFCNAVTNIGNQSASNGGEIAFSNKVTQNCGMGSVNNDQTNTGVAQGSTQSSTGSQAGVTPSSSSKTTTPSSSSTTPSSSSTTPSSSSTTPSSSSTTPQPSKTTTTPTTTPPPATKTDASGSKTDASGSKTDASGSKTDASGSKTVAPTPPPKNNNMLLIGGALVSCCCIVVIVIIVIMSKKKKTNK